MGSSNVSRTVRLIVVESNRNAREYLKRSLTTSANNVRVVGEADTIDDGLRLARGLQPDMILLELPVNATETLDKVRALREAQPHTAVIISTHAPSPQLILSCMRAGAQEFVGHPIDAVDVEKAITRVQRLMESTTSPTRTNGLVLSVFSSKGGIGASTVAANLGVAFATRDDNPRTIIVDLSFQMGDLALMLDQPPRYSLLDAFDEGRLDEAKLSTMVAKHGSGADVLTVATGPEVAEDVTRQHMVELFGTLNTLYDVVVVDIGRQLDDRTLEVMELCDGVLLLTSQDVPTNRNASRYMEIFQRLQINPDKIQLVVNRFHKKSRLSIKDIETALDAEIFWSLPNDFGPISEGIDSGNPAVLQAPKSKVAQSFRRFANALSHYYEDRSLADTAPQAASN